MQNGVSCLPRVSLDSRPHEVGDELPLKDQESLRAPDVIFCDSIALPEVKKSKAGHYRLVARASLEYLASALAFFQHS